MTQVGIALPGTLRQPENSRVLHQVSGLVGHDPVLTEDPAWTVAHFAAENPQQLAAARDVVRAVNGTFLEVPADLTDGPGLLVSDVDSTLITAEVIELIAERAGTRDLVAAVTERAMRGELDFAESLTERVATLTGVPQSVFADVRAEVSFSPGAPELAERLDAAGWTFALVSGGFTEIVSGLAADLNITRFVANHLEVRDGVLTGKVLGDIVTARTKAEMLQQWSDELSIPLARTVAVGDGANDLEMMATAAVGVAYCAKPVVAEAATTTIDFPRLDVIAPLLGL